MSDEASSRMERARESIAGLPARELITLRSELDELIGDRSQGEDTGGQWDYQRQPWGRGWIQRECKNRPRKDGSVRTYAYWSFHWIETGKRRSEHIGSDEKLQQWKERNSG